MKSTIILICAILLSGCVATNQKDPNNQHLDNMIQFRAEIKEYIPNAFHDQMDDGKFTSLDGTQINILSPSNYASQQITILHSSIPEESSFWRIPATIILFKIDSSRIKPNQDVFIGALTDIQKE